jgi:hypothetical protein
MKKNNKIILSTLTSLVAPCAFIGVLSVGDNLRTDDKKPTNLVGVDNTISEAIPITNHITDKRNIGSF